MVVREFKASRFRCLEDVELEFDPHYNLIYGQNASGKTSLLEALAYLGRGKSFRGAPRQAVVAHGERDFIVFGRVASGGREATVGIRNGAENLEIRIDGDGGKGVAELAALVPLQVIDPEVHSLIAGGPEQRRRFMDWIVFHVEHEYLVVWRRFKRVLKQRNSLLKQGGPAKVLDSWDEEFIELAEQVKEMSQYAKDHALTIAVMGCRVNGPGETDDADLGLWCGPNYVNLKKGEESLGAYPYDQILGKLKEQLDLLIAAQVSK